MTQSPRSSPCSTSHSTVPLVKSLMTRSTATPQPSIIIPVWPVGTMTADGAVAAGRRDELQRDRHLADGAVGADGQDHALAGQVLPPDGRLHPVRRPPVVDEPRAGRGGRRRELRVVAEELVQPGVDVEAGGDRLEDRRAPRGRQLAAGRGDADQQAVRPDRAVRAPRRGCATNGMSNAGQELPQVAAGHGRVEDGDDVVAAVADDAHRGLGVVDAELALGQDDQSARFGRRHPGSLFGARTPATASVRLVR